MKPKPVSPSAVSASKTPMWELTLFAVGHQTHIEGTVAGLKAECDAVFGEQYRLEVVDLMDQPDRAAALDVMATPTLIRLRPEPLRRVFGSLADPVRMLSALGVPTGGRGRTTP